MFESATNRAPESAPPKLGELLEDVLLQARDLVQAELSLAGKELKQELKMAVRSALLLLVAAMLFQAALVVLGVLLVLQWGAGSASLAVVLVLAGGGVALSIIAVRSLRRERLPRTTARLSQDAKQLMETVK